jgi:hypothetical protein
MEKGVKENHVAVTALHNCRKIPFSNFLTLKTTENFVNVH